MYLLYEQVEHKWLLVNTFQKLKSAVYNAIQLHDMGEIIKLVDKEGNDHTDLIWQ